jgi:hypothetical protein
MNPMRAFLNTGRISFYWKVLIVFAVLYVLAGIILFLVESRSPEGRVQCGTLVEAYW